MIFWIKENILLLIKYKVDFFSNESNIIFIKDKIKNKIKKIDFLDRVKIYNYEVDKKNRLK